VTDLLVASSGKHINEIIEAGLELPDVNQIELHPFCQQRPIVEYCQAKRIAVQAYSPLVTGQLDHDVLKRLATKVCAVLRHFLICGLTRRSAHSIIKTRHRFLFDGHYKRGKHPEAVNFRSKLKIR
jgi:diketogulonate reductase-like aldo/keto reductase